MTSTKDCLQDDDINIGYAEEWESIVATIQKVYPAKAYVIITTGVTAHNINSSMLEVYSSILSATDMSSSQFPLETLEGEVQKAETFVCRVSDLREAIMKYNARLFVRELTEFRHYAGPICDLTSSEDITAHEKEGSVVEIAVRLTWDS